MIIKENIKELESSTSKLIEYLKEKIKICEKEKINRKNESFEVSHYIHNYLIDYLMTRNTVI